MYACLYRHCRKVHELLGIVVTIAYKMAVPGSGWDFNGQGIQQSHHI